MTVFSIRSMDKLDTLTIASKLDQERLKSTHDLMSDKKYGMFICAGLVITGAYLYCEKVNPENKLVPFLLVTMSAGSMCLGIYEHSTMTALKNKTYGLHNQIRTYESKIYNYKHKGRHTGR